ncbi:MAG: hypothetical protein ACRCT2_13850 [Plesiomonas shigelloides]
MNTYTTIDSIDNSIALELINCDTNCGGPGSCFASDLAKNSLLFLGVNTLEGIPGYPVNTCPLPRQHWDYAHAVIDELLKTDKFTRTTQYKADGKTPLCWPYVLKPELSPETCKELFQTVSRHPAVQEVQVQPDGKAIVILKPIAPGDVPNLLNAIDQFHSPI